MATDRTIELANRLLTQGQLAEAERLFRELLGERPGLLTALEGLGVVLYQQGRPEEAAAVFARGVAIEPRSVRFQVNLGEALRAARRLDQALEHLRRAVELGPTDILAWNSLGLVSFDLGRYEAAVDAYHAAIRLGPRFVRARVNLAGALRALGRFSDAVDAVRAALRLEPNNPLALINLANALCDMSDPGVLVEAEAAGRGAVALAPRHPRALGALARVLRQQGRPAEAVPLEARASEIARAAVQPPTRGGDALPAECNQALSRYTRGIVYLTEGQTDLAEARLREAIRLDPTLASAWVALATVQAERGQIELSCGSARHALQLRPDLAEAYWRLANNLVGQLPADELQAMERLALDESLSNDDRALLHFGLATVLDQRGLFARAAANLEIANSQQAAGKLGRGITYNPDLHAAFIDRIISIMTPEFLARGAGWGEPDPRPVFVVGFPRSGTTLTEQILASHPQVTGAGELHDLGVVFQALPQLVGGPVRVPVDALDLLGPASVKSAARRYLTRLDALAPSGAVRIVDKMPENLNHLGLIALLFSNAKVIICRRDPRDIALSCWQTGFRSCAWNNHWDHIARRLAGYQRMLAHWERVRPIPVLDLDYEDLVADLEQHARRLIDFIGLDWHPSCLEFHSNPREVRTPSLAQVRRPIHSRSAGRWRNYEAYVPRLFQAFERYGVETRARD